MKAKHVIVYLLLAIVSSSCIREEALNAEGDFDKVTILKPYSFVLVDEEKETIAELLLVDDDTILVNDELLKGLDKELDEFLKELLEK